MRLRIECAYDGTDFCGWAKQPDQRSVQGELESALSVVLRFGVRTVCAGRTDAGVHARGQVVHVDIDDDVWTKVTSGDGGTVQRRLNGVLPSDLRVSSVTPAPSGFDARFSALRRHYRYYVTDGVSDPLVRKWVLAHSQVLDCDRMNRASALLIGEHDFRTFCRERDGASAVRTLIDFTWHRDDRGVVTASICADAFCHSMVRSLVGAMLPVGDGRRDTEWPADLLAARRRDSTVAVASAHALVLERVDYPADADLASQAERARRWRGHPDDAPGSTGR